MNEKRIKQALQQIAEAHSMLSAELEPPSHSAAAPIEESVVAEKASDRSTTGFGFSKASLAELKGVNDDLVRCVQHALFFYTKIDFRVYDGIRTVEEQRKYVAAGTSKTMNSKHLDGLAVDLVPIIGGVLKWDWIGCYEIARAMDAAATELGIAHRITWGGAWDRTLDQIGGSPDAYVQAVEEYKRRHPGPDFIDGPHFEIRA
jgi:peptidoglycan L-alanyl-D-glutamate endopeptidase CwlK